MNAEEIILQGQDFLAKKLAELEARIDRISFEPTATAEIPQEEPKQSEDRAIKVLQRSPEVHTIHTGGGGRYTGPFAVSRTSYDGTDYTYTVASGRIQVAILSRAGLFETTVYEMAGTSQVCPSGTIYLELSIGISVIGTGYTVSPSASVFWPNDLGETTDCKIAIAEVADGVITQRMYGDMNVFLPEGNAMKVCEDGIEVCILNFGQVISCSEMGLSIG